MKARFNNLPVIDVVVGDERVRALVDTGCSTTVTTERLCKRYRTNANSVVTVDGNRIDCLGTGYVDIVVGGVCMTIACIVMGSVIEGVDIVVGMDVIGRMGGVRIGSSGNSVVFGNVGVECAGVSASENAKVRTDEVTTACSIADKDFVAEFDGEKWVVEYKWKGEPPVLKNSVGIYSSGLTESVKERFDDEIGRWIRDGILTPWKEEVNEGVIPLMAVVQANKGKVRPVLDFRELNDYVSCHTGDDVTDVCSDVLRKWRQVEGGTSIVDLKAAYLQIHVSEKLWRYQLVRYKNKTYCLTRLGFGLCSAPKIMSRILKMVLSSEENIRAATYSYIDDILVDETVISAAAVVEHLSRFGFEAKSPEPLKGGSALGLRLESGDSGGLVYHRGNDLPTVDTDLTRRELFSICGKLVGHYPVAGWLRTACSFIKRNAEGDKWGDPVGAETVTRIREVVDTVKRKDPVSGVWNVKEKEHGVVWCDASNLALGVILEIGNVVVEDGAWLRKKDDFSHINVAELEAVMKGVNLGLKWGLRVLEVKTDSATVNGWLKCVIDEEKKVRTKGAAEMIVKRRLGTLKQIIDEYDLVLSVSLVPTLVNKADVLTRVKKSWLPCNTNSVSNVNSACCVSIGDWQRTHDWHHLGVDRTHYIARKLDPSVTRKAVKRVVGSCQRCQMICPSPVRHEPGKLHVDANWQRLAVDVTHYKGIPYLTMIDCGPSRFGIWRKLNREAAAEITRNLENVFLERGPVSEVLMDNGTAFRSAELRAMMERWNVQQLFRAAYRPEGNGIVERNHRTIKTIAERSSISPLQAVFWYNATPKSGQLDASVPQRSIFQYEWRYPFVEPTIDAEVDDGSPLVIGEEVWVKPPNARCTTPWTTGKVTQINSRNNIAIDGTPRHVLDIRRMTVDATSSSDSGEEHGSDTSPRVANENNTNVRRYPTRERRRPAWMADYDAE